MFVNYVRTKTVHKLVHEAFELCVIFLLLLFRQKYYVCYSALLYAWPVAQYGVALLVSFIHSFIHRSFILTLSNATTIRTCLR